MNPNKPDQSNSVWELPVTDDRSPFQNRQFVAALFRKKSTKPTEQTENQIK